MNVGEAKQNLPAMKENTKQPNIHTSNLKENEYQCLFSSVNVKVLISGDAKLLKRQTREDVLLASIPCEALGVGVPERCSGERLRG